MAFPYQHISVIIIPTDYCNMNCVYCFNSRRTAKQSKVMTIDTVEHIFRCIIPYYKDVYFIWHGGEPLSMGVDFYRKVVQLQNSINTNGSLIRNTIQTNLTLMTVEMAKTLQELNIKVGSSYDGTQNELTRHSSNAIMKGHHTLLEQGGRNGFICVVQRNNINCLIQDYEWFKSNKINYTINQYLAAPNTQDNLAVSASEYIDRVNKLFDYWVRDAECDIDIAYFEQLVDYFLFQQKTLCCYNSCLGKHIGILPDGRIYNCNRDFDERYCFGNIHDYKDIHECFESDGFMTLAADAVCRRKQCMQHCDIYSFCEGGCNNVALVNGSVTNPNSFFCETLRGVYRHIERYIQAILGAEEEALNPYITKVIDKYRNSRK